tara:strand:+ start:388 stop:579 length:192 start_codon:yes stop_codon:yes gene_type:complete
LDNIGKNMTDMTKYKNVSLSKEITKKIDKLSKELVPHGQLSRSKVIEIIVNEKLSNFIKSKEV